MFFAVVALALFNAIAPASAPVVSCRFDVTNAAALFARGASPTARSSDAAIPVELPLSPKPPSAACFDFTKASPSVKAATVAGESSSATINACSANTVASRSASSFDAQAVLFTCVSGSSV